MNLMDCMMDEFHDEAKMKSMNENDICSWLEVCEHTHCYYCSCYEQLLLFN